MKLTHKRTGREIDNGLICPGVLLGCPLRVLKFPNLQKWRLFTKSVLPREAVLDCRVRPLYGAMTSS
jgi:hypothetical protein